MVSKASLETSATIFVSSNGPNLAFMLSVSSRETMNGGFLAFVLSARRLNV